MNQGTVHNISAETPIRELGDDDVMFVWSQMIRNRPVDDRTVQDLLCGTRYPASASEVRLVEVGKEMAERDLFASHCLIVN